jgi:hypothetical protein
MARARPWQRSARLGSGGANLADLFRRAAGYEHPALAGLHQTHGSARMRQFFLGLLVGIVIGAAGATIYFELSSAPEEELIEGAPAGER